jgi:hypothetical protein
MRGASASLSLWKRPLTEPRSGFARRQLPSPASGARYAALLGNRGKVSERLANIG